MSRHILSAVLVLCFSVVTHARTITIAADEVERALVEYHRQTGVEFLYLHPTPDVVAKTKAVRHEKDYKVALDRMLIGLGIKIGWITSGFVVLGGPQQIINKPETHARLGHKPVAPPIRPERCTCAQSIGGEPLGPWCRDADEHLIYAPAACGA